MTRTERAVREYLKDRLESLRKDMKYFADTHDFAEALKIEGAIEELELAMDELSSL